MLLAADAARTSERRALRQMLLQRCFLTIDALEPIPPTDAATPWFFYGCGLTLRRDGLLLAANALVAELERFHSTQIATYGMSALPLLGAAIARSPRPLTGLFVRESAKPYGTRRLIEGCADPSVPVVFIDESITMGASAKRAIRTLEEAGYEVEGVLALVDLSGHGTERFFPARGYTRRVLFDVYDDLGKLRSSPARGERPVGVERSLVRVPDGLSPADAVRFCARLQGALPLAPARFDAAYDAAGGFHVSVRRDDSGSRVGRASARGTHAQDLPEAIILAGARALSLARESGVDPDRCAIAVTIVGTEKPADLRDLDHRKHLLTLRAKDGSWRAASTLPNVEFFQSEVGQIAHVQRKGRFTPEERFDAFAADVVRSVESAKRWPRYGAPPKAADWTAGTALAAYLRAHVRSALARMLGSEPPSLPAPVALPEPVYGIGVSLYAGSLIGCHLAFGEPLRDCIERATREAWDDDRFRTDRPARPEDIDVLVTLLHERRVLPKMPLAEAARYVLIGRHSVAAYADKAFSIILAPYGVLGEYRAARFLEDAAHKARIPVERARWLTFETAAWLFSESSDGVPLERAIPRRMPGGVPTTTSLSKRLERHCAYVASTVQTDGVPIYAHEVESGAQVLEGSTARLLFAAWALEEGRRALEPAAARAASGLQTFLRALQNGGVRRAISWDSAGDAMLLSVLDALDDEALLARFAPPRVERLARLVHGDGAVFEGRRIDCDLDLLSGSVMAALGALHRRGVRRLETEQVARVFAFYRRRFDLVAPWGMVWWHAAAWYAWRHVFDTYGFVCELAEFALARQHRSSGAFLTDLCDEPSFHTACVLEGIVTAWRFALERGDAARVRRYRDAWFEGQRFMDALTYKPGDNYFLRRVSLDGAVRAMPTSANVRIDFVAHAIASLARGLDLLRSTGARSLR